MTLSRDENPLAETPESLETGDNALSILVISLLKGVVYRDDDSQRWQSLLRLQARVRDYVAVLGLELLLDEAEGYAVLKSREDEDSETLPRLITRRPLSFPVSLLLALLRKKLAEADASGGETRLVLSRDEILELIRVFLPDTSNEAKLTDQMDRHINKIIELGFLRRLRQASEAEPRFEVRRILKTFVDADWLADFDQRLAEYRDRLRQESTGYDRA